MNCLLYLALCGGTHKERLKDLHLFRLQESCLHEDSVPGFICLVVTEREKPDFVQQCMPKDPSGGHKPLRGKFWLDNRTESFTVRVVKHSNGPEKLQTMLELLKAQLDKLLKPALLWAGGSIRDFQRSLPTGIILLFCNWRCTWMVASLESTQSKNKLIYLTHLESKWGSYSAILVTSEWLSKISNLVLNSKCHKMTCNQHCLESSDKQ